jgi:predicted DNA-binding transcriptional regulator AlpA
MLRYNLSFSLPDGRMTTRSAAAFLGLSVSTLATMRSKGTGPKFIRMGRIFYFQSDLEDWIRLNPRVQSTAQARHFSLSPSNVG